MTTTPPKGRYPLNQKFNDWLNDLPGRAQYFQKIDPFLTAPMISKIKYGAIPITLETAVRIERAQKPSARPLKAEDLVTFSEDRELVLYMRGQVPPPPPAIEKEKPQAYRREKPVAAGAPA